MLVAGLLTAFLATVAEAQRANWGPGIFMTARGGVKTFTGTLTPGSPPNDEKKFVAIWPGLWSSRALGYDLVQTVTSSHDRSYMQSFCGAKKGQWCTQVYVLRTMRPVTPNKGYPLDWNDNLLIQYDLRNGQWWQQITNLSKGRKVLDTLTAGDKKATDFALQTEMQQSARGTSDDQIYTNITLVLESAEPGFGATLRKTGKVNMDNPRTTDGGKTWTINKVVLGAMYPGTSFNDKNGGGTLAKGGAGVGGSSSGAVAAPVANAPAAAAAAPAAGASISAQDILARIMQALQSRRTQ